MSGYRASPYLWVVSILIAGVAAGIAAFWLAILLEDAEPIKGALVGEAAPDFSLPTLGDTQEPLTLATLRSEGRPVVLNFFASWCAPCRAEHPLLMRLASEGVPVFGIAYQDTTEDAVAFLDELGNPFRAVAMDNESSTAQPWRLIGIPDTIVVDSAGTVIARHTGPMTEASMRRRIMPALSAP